jgi:serine/threonine-protein kinase HipA
MAQQDLVVLDGPLVVGTLKRSAGDITFSYNPAWQHRDHATPLSVSLPLTVQVHGHDVVSPWLWGLLPDNERVISRWGRTFHTTTRHPLGLLAAVGRDLPGRFTIVPAGQEADAVPSGVEWLTESDVASLLREVRADQSAWLGTQGSGGRWSLAGTQAKIALFSDGRRWGRPYGRAATTHILKPAIGGLDDHDLNEHLCLQAARGAGVVAVASRVVTVGDERAISVERYDRIIGADQTIQRIHQEDLCQALQVHPDAKYESDGGPSVSRIGSLLERHVHGEPARPTRMRFVEALALNWLLAGSDAHAKNYSLLLSGAQVRLAPLYDVASALPYRDFHAPKFTVAMKLGGTYLAGRVGTKQWHKVAAQLLLEEHEVLNRIHQLATALPAAMTTAAEARPVRELKSALPERLTDLVAARCRVLLAHLD